MLTKLPTCSSVTPDPIWIPDKAAANLSTSHRSFYRGHYHKTKIPGPDCLIAGSKKSKVSAYLSTLPLSPPKDYEMGLSGQNWLGKAFNSKEVKWRRGNNLALSQEPFDVVSNYQMFFTPKYPEPRRSYVPQHIPLQTPEKFTSISTYNSDFMKTSHSVDDLRCMFKVPEPRDILTWKNEEKNVQVVQRKAKELPPLESVTSYRTEFQYRPAEHMSIIKPKAETIHYKRSSSPFNCESSYKSDYKGCHQYNYQETSPRHTTVGVLQREFNQDQPRLFPYLEYQKPIFYSVEKE